MAGEVEQFYDQNPDHEWERLERHRTEFAVTLRAFAEYLPPPPARILDIGGGPGRYAIALAQQGYQVTLLDLSGQMLGLAREKAQEHGVTLADYVHANALDLKPVPDASCDAVLLMGPLYHLVAEAERQRAVQEAHRVLRPSGRILAAFITRYASLRKAARDEPAWLVEHHQEHEQILATGMYYFRPGSGFTSAFFAHPTEIAPFMATYGFAQLEIIACEGVISLIEDKVNQLTGDLWNAWVDLNYHLGKDPTVHGAAGHLLYIGEKRSISE